MGPPGRWDADPRRRQDATAARDVTRPTELPDVTFRASPSSYRGRSTRTTRRDRMAGDEQPRPMTPTTDDRFARAWLDDRRYVLTLATRMLGDATAADDVVQEAYSRLAQADLDAIDNVRAWLVVVVRRLCLDRLRSAHARRETAAGTAFTDDDHPANAPAAVDPADRVTLDDEVQLALAVVLDRL